MYCRYLGGNKEKACDDRGPQLCILGSSLCACIPMGELLGLGARAHIEWRGLCGMQWSQLFRVAVLGQVCPNVLVVHLGSNDLAKHCGKASILAESHVPGDGQQSSLG